MANSITSFIIANDSKLNLTIVHEPECFEFKLPPGEDVIIEVNSSKESIIMKQYADEEGIIISLLSEKSDYRVVYQGVDVFEEYFR